MLGKLFKCKFKKMLPYNRINFKFSVRRNSVLYSLGRNSSAYISHRL